MTVGITVLYTIGHGTAPIDAFVDELRGARIELVVDVRRFPGSRRNPQFGSDALAQSLHEGGIAYRHDVALGGRRRAGPDSVNTALRNEAFRAYADYMATADFHAARDHLFAQAAEHRIAIACSETLWWRCHRRLIADVAVLVAELPVLHLLLGTPRQHIVTEGARRLGNDVVYDGKAM